VPATSANLGPGFDILGLALRLHNTFTIAPAASTSIEASGYAEGLPRDQGNLFYQAFAHLFDLAGEKCPHVHIAMQIDIPPGRGLGSSATAVVGGLVAANAWLGGHFSSEQMLVEAVKLERGQHADNVAPALLGGLVVNVVREAEVVSLKVPFPSELRAVLFVPDFEMDTVRGRALMPEAYSREDAVFNASRVALFLSALEQRRFDLLRTAMEDRMHQPYRAQLFPLLPELISGAVDAGAYGACLSGGGSSVLALAAEDAGEAVGVAMQRIASSGAIAGEVRVMQVDEEGATVASLAGENDG
jgi:homoserine kinase